jgi:hypothetical protein
VRLTRNSLVAAALVATIAAAGCTSNTPNGPAPSSVPGTVQAGVSPPNAIGDDLVIAGVSAKQTIASTALAANMSFTLKVVPKDTQLSCDKYVVDGTQSQLPFYCVEGTEKFVAVPANLTTRWKDYPPTAVRYYLARSGLLANKAFLDVSAFACGAAWIAVKRQPDFTTGKAEAFLEVLALNNENDTERVHAARGMNVALAGEPIDHCISALSVEGIAVERVLEEARVALGGTYRVVLVPRGETRPCTGSQVSGTHTNMPIWCPEQGYIAVPWSIVHNWKGYGGARTRYELALTAVRARGTFLGIGPEACAAAFIAVKYDSPHADTPQRLLEALTERKEGFSAAIQGGAEKGIQAVQHDRTLDACKS